MARAAQDCRLDLPDHAEVRVTGRFLARPSHEGAIPFRVDAGLDGCRGVVRALWPRDEPVPSTGERRVFQGRWEARDYPDPARPEWAGRLRITSVGPLAAGSGGLAGRVVELRGAVADRIAVLWGERAPMVEALILARREHLDPELRDAFGLSGTAHLLAISGFHVGVVAGLLLATLRTAGLRPRPAAIGAAAGSWLYVLAIGAPDAALRASVLLSLLAAARLRGTPVVSVGTLSSAFLLLLIMNPGSLASIGFQLSFAGTWGLVTLRRPIESILDRGWRRIGRRPPRRRPGAGAGERWLRGSSEGLTAGLAATLPTLPLLAWHFDRISLVGVPATLAVAPGVALAIPGVGLALGASVIWHEAGAFLAGGVGLILAGVEWGVRLAAGLPGASIWVSRPVLLAGGSALLLTVVLLQPMAGRIRRPARWVLGASAGAVAALILPILPSAATLDIHMIDVGQGDALVLRLPSGEWIGIDAGPASENWDAGARRVVPYLRRHGARRLELLVLSHPHLDHLGGAAAVLDEIAVATLLDPAIPTASAPYLSLLERARERGIPLRPARSGTVLGRSGVRIEVLHPDPGDSATGFSVHGDPNDWSVVLLVEWGEAAVLLTGDAYASTEIGLTDRLPALTVLKAGHHGSRTSTSRELLSATRPEWVMIPAGDGNSFGHPHREVMDRLADVGTRIVRTDRDGSVRLRLRRDGSVEVDTRR